MTQFLYPLHRAALVPLLDSPGRALSPDCLATIGELGEPAFAEFVIAQGLAPLWHEHLAALAEDPFSSDFHQQLKTERFNAAAVYLLQKNALATIRGVLDEKGIAHVVFKGTHLRELIYRQPALRVATDIDLLVQPADRQAAVEALGRAGFGAVISPETISHELTLTKGCLDIDLHWDILRPGRTRVPLTAEFVRQRRDFSSHWGPSPEASLFLMLVHPVITKYCTTPYSSVIRLLDIVRWMDREKPDWAGVAELLERAGLKTAAWIMLEWLRLLTGKLPPEDFTRAIRPGAMRRRYLAHWIAQNYSTRLLGRPLLIQLGFTLPAHDRLSDVIRAVRAILRARREAGGLE
ncbi:nucleotidyltransferase family protein [Pseudomonas sp. N040]|uniref:nucleotidyltransferase family protein n=1 Tax=Pseudomonas sp. N040 TaxID=2785325 RepID=UPI0018A30ACE|nr:nucleotidyltransferase family protein [Pseudomonas sp. N040]MBF7730492.1 nucleotidyltransferase family protein [Pseudomonas sp. N040]MBW7014135.1 nucleotidyltransferase family protein [Pseudomonas sp. N040]